MGPHSEPVEKAELRLRLGELDPVSEEASAAVAEALFGWMSMRLPVTVAGYLAMPDEVDLEPLMGRLPGWRWVLPRVEPGDELTFRDASVPREVHRWGMTQPVDAGEVVPVVDIDMLLVPGVAFDLRGRRLGRGKGFYDRVLAAKRVDATSVGVTVQSRVVDRVPTGDDDMPVDYLAVEGRVIDCPAR